MIAESTERIRVDGTRLGCGMYMAKAAHIDRALPEPPFRSAPPAGVLPSVASKRSSMSFTVTEQAPARLNRSELAVPGSQPKLFEKAAKSEADVIFLDLEDAVAPDDKPQARKNVIQAIND